MRASGRTTRRANKIIENLFEYGAAVVIDHHNTVQSNRELARKVISRMIFEKMIKSNKDVIFTMTNEVGVLKLVNYENIRRD